MQITILSKHTMPKGTTGEYIGRGSPLGNPYTHMQGTKAGTVVGTREEAIKLYKTWLLGRINDGDTAVCDELNRLYALAQREPLNLVCFCKPQACHGDVIAGVLMDAYRTSKGN